MSMPRTELRLLRVRRSRTQLPKLSPFSRPSHSSQVLSPRSTPPRLRPCGIGHALGTRARTAALPGLARRRGASPPHPHPRRALYFASRSSPSASPIEAKETTLALVSAVPVPGRGAPAAASALVGGGTRGARSPLSTLRAFSHCLSRTRPRISIATGELRRYAGSRPQVQCVRAPSPPGS